VAVSIVASLAAVLALLVSAAPRPAAVHTLVQIESWPPTVEPVEPVPSPHLRTAPPPGWEPMPEPPLVTTTSPVPAALAPLADNPAQAVANAYAEGVASGRFWRAAVALYDRHTGTFYGAGDTEAGYRAASVIKPLIAARILRGGRADGRPLTSTDWTNLWNMITCSSNDAADTLWWLAGGWHGVIEWVKSTYGISLIFQSERPEAWGTTWITARGMVQFYAAVYNDPAVAPWLVHAMANANLNCGGQYWGLPVVASDWAVKQGWVCCWKNPAEPQTRLHSTGYVGGYRFIAVLLTEGPQALYWGAGRSYVTAMAQALLPGGTVPTEPEILVPHDDRPSGGDTGPGLPPTVHAPPSPVAPPPGRPPGTGEPGLP
jgi:hypothetical protein